MTDTIDQDEQADIERSEDAPVRTLEETARFFDVSVPTVREWIAKGCPVVERGGNGRAYRVDLRAVHQWREAQREEERQAEQRKAQTDAQLRLELLGGDELPDPETGDILTPKQRQEYLKAEVEKTKLAQQRRELVKAAEMGLAISQAFGELKQRLQVLPDELAKYHGWDEEQTAQALELVNEVLEDASNTLSQLTRPADGASGDVSQ